jgi:hypothetical protein
MQTTKTSATVNYTNVPVQETRVAVEPVAHVYTSNEKKAAIGVMLAAGGCMTCGLLVVLLFILAIPVLKLIIGHYYRDQCPIQPKIPLFLFIGGIVGIICILFPMIINVLALIQRMKAKKRGEGGKSTLTRILSIVTVLLSAFLFIWLICGAIWTFGIYNKVSYDETNQWNYCHKTLYRFTIILLMLAFLQVLGQCFCAGIGSKVSDET